MNMKKLAAAAMAVCMSVVSLAGCSGKSPEIAASYNGGDIPAGVYIMHQVNAVNDAYNKLGNPYLSADTMLEQEIEGVNAEQWITDRTVELVKSYAAVSSEAQRLGVSLDETFAAQIDQQIENNWKTEGSIMEGLGISLSSAKAVARNNQLANEVFAAIYGEGGEKAIPDDELKAFYSDNYAASLMVILSLKDLSTGAALDEEKAAEVKKVYEDYKARIAAGESVFDIYQAESARQRELNGVTDPVEIKESEHVALVRKDSASYPEGLREKLFAAGYNTPQFYEDDNYLVIFDRRDVLADEAGYQGRRDSLSMIYKSDEFKADLVSKADAAGFKLNDNVVKKFTVKKILEVNY